MPTGSEEIARGMQEALRRMTQGALAGAYQAANNVMTEAKERCPVDKGTLKGSGYVAPPELDGDALTVSMGFGGPAEKYAIAVHEKIEVRHPVGEAKFLERAMDNQRDRVGPTIAAAVRKALGGG